MTKWSANGNRNEHGGLQNGATWEPKWSRKDARGGARGVPRRKRRKLRKAWPGQCLQHVPGAAKGTEKEPNRPKAGPIRSLKTHPEERRKRWRKRRHLGALLGGFGSPGAPDGGPEGTEGSPSGGRNIVAMLPFEGREKETLKNLTSGAAGSARRKVRRPRGDF